MHRIGRIDFVSGEISVTATRSSLAVLAVQLCGTALLEKTRLSMMRSAHQAAESTKGKRAVCPKAANDERQFRSSGIPKASNKTDNASDAGLGLPVHRPVPRILPADAACAE
jgi:hypothetical protein